MTMRLVRHAPRPVSKSFKALDVMTPNPKSIDQGATVRETAEVLQDNGIHIAPVIDAAGRPIGVVSRTDLLDYWRRRRDRLAAMAAGELESDSNRASACVPGDELTVREIMTPVVFSVPIHAPIAKIIDKILALEVRCLFVTDESGVLVGVISVFDLLRTPMELRNATEKRSCNEPLHH